MFFRLNFILITSKSRTSHCKLIYLPDTVVVDTLLIVVDFVGIFVDIERVVDDNVVFNTKIQKKYLFKNTTSKVNTILII